MPLLNPDFIARIDRLDLISRKILQGKMRGERRSQRRGHSVEFADFRNYTSGDDIRFLDWNVYARLDRLFLKLFRAEEDLALYVLIDTSASMNFGEPNKFDHARRLAAALGYVGLVNQHRVSIGAVSDELVADTGPMRGRRRVAGMIDFIERLTPAGATDFTRAFRRYAMAHRTRGVLVLISDFLVKSGLDTALRYVVGSNFDFFGLQVISPQEESPDLVGDLRLVDVEDDDHAQISITPQLIRQYRARLAGHCKALKDHITRRGGSYLFTTTKVAPETVVLSYLRDRRLLG